MSNDNSKHRPLGVTAIALLTILQGALMLVFRGLALAGIQLSKGQIDFFLSFISKYPHILLQIAFGALSLALGIAMFYGFKWVWYISVALWAVDVVFGFVWTLGLSFFSLVWILEMAFIAYFITPDVKQHFHVDIDWRLFGSRR